MIYPRKTLTLESSRAPDNLRAPCRLRYAASTEEAECALGKDLKMCGDGLPQSLSQCLSLSKTEEQGERDSSAFCTLSYLRSHPALHPT